MIVRDVARKLNLFGFDVDWKEKSLKERFLLHMEIKVLIWKFLLR